MPKKIFKAAIFMLVIGLGWNAYAQVTEEDIEYAQERLIQEKNALAEEKSQLKSLFKEVREIIKSVDSLKKENAILRDDLVKSKEANTKLESDNKGVNIKNLELQQMLKKDDAKEVSRLKTELEKYKARAPKDKESPEPVKKEPVKKEPVKKEAVKKDLPDALDPLKKENAMLQAELAKLKEFNAALQKKAEGLYTQNQELAQAKDDAKSLGSMVEYLNREREALKKLNAKLQQDMLKLQDDTRKEKAALNEELGTAYVQAKLYDLAIAAYEKSVKLVPGNAEVYYDLGLLYKHNPPGNREKAIWNLKRYLQLNPKAKNKAEVEYIIQMLSELPDRKIGLW